ncbi:MAG: hypothetical protein IPP51_11065 [Bacteroidetes bacterium]|nr:hypothetical protein [Bacteroidota bacterium]
MNYIDVFNATHGGSPVVRQIDYTNIEGNSTDSVYLSFTDTILCRNILFQSVEIKDTNNNVLTSLTGINAHQFRLPVVVANVPTGMILHVRETLSFPNFDSTCVATCPIDSNTFSSHLLYGCYDFSHSGTAENLCMKRKSEGLITLGDKIPRILISRSEPAPNVPGTGSYWDTTFTANPLTHWKFIIWNDSNNVVKDFSILLGHQAYDSTYRYFIPDSSHITVTMHTVHGIPQGDSAYLFRDIYHAPNLPNCIVNNYPNALGAYQKRFDVLYPHDTVEVDFDLVYCCAEPDDGRNTYSLFDTPKSFNTWYLQANGFDECGDEVHGESYLDMANGLYGIEPLFFISQTGEPMYLVQDFSPVNLNFNTDPNTGCSAPIQFHISNQDFGKDHNQIDYSRAAANFFSTDYDLTDGNLMQVHGKVIFQFDLQPGITLEHSLANDIVLSNSIGSWTIESFQSNGATCAAGGSYRVVFNIDSVPGGTTLNNFYDFMNSSTLYFRITGCCCNNSNTNPFFSIKTYMSGLDANCEIPMAKREATASIHCHGCTLPGGVVNASSEPLTRKSFGFVDFDNDGLMDLPQTRVDSSYIAGHPDIALNSSIVGDTLYSVINGSVEDKGSINLATLRGTYGLNLRHLYIEQKIPHSNSSEFDVRMDKLNITMRIGASIYTANLLPSDAMFAVIVHDVRDSTLLAIHPHSDIYFYDLSETAIRSLFSLPSYVLDSATHFSLRPIPCM